MRHISPILLLIVISTTAGCCSWFQRDDRLDALQQFCQPKVAYSGTSIAFSGVSIPFGGASPLKIGSFEIKPEVVQQASAALQILDAHRETSCVLLVTMDSKAPGYQARLQNALTDDEHMTELALVLSQAPDKLDDWLKTQSSWISGTIQQDKPAMAASPTLSESVTKFSNSSPGSYRQAVQTGNASWTLDQDVDAGDCTLHQGSALSIANDTASYTLNASTARSFSGDIWHETWYFYDKSGALLGQLSADTGRFMPNAIHAYSGNVQIASPFKYSDVAAIKWFGQC